MQQEMMATFGRGLGLTIGAIGALASPAEAQITGAPVVAEQPSQDAALPGPTNARRSYDAAYFAKYAPATALQMVERVPGSRDRIGRSIGARVRADGG
ncbi:hypothetical protein H5J25_06315 [Sphingomonas aliaeris]|uniref:Uncharacterized protein n=1 Tax=Sphingomonas aliaeris TaxID=2759526 RepID=A0A974NWF0_9SPHN|nr:hypothetical protein [Sphingomonas aliaeris]QQV78289.1 hypothetical protein H5J25_06315 [Sphingomonas aliaeris]